MFLKIVIVIATPRSSHHSKKLSNLSIKSIGSLLRIENHCFRNNHFWELRAKFLHVNRANGYAFHGASRINFIYWFSYLYPRKQGLEWFIKLAPGRMRLVWIGCVPSPRRSSQRTSSERCQRPILNFAPRGNFDPRAKLSPRVTFVPWRWSYPLGMKLPVCPSILLNSKECSPLGVNEGVNISNRGQISPVVNYIMYSLKPCSIEGHFTKMI
jgi:hypothetical protein